MRYLITIISAIFLLSSCSEKNINHDFTISYQVAVVEELTDKFEAFLLRDDRAFKKETNLFTIIPINKSTTIDGSILIAHFYESEGEFVANKIIATKNNKFLCCYNDDNLSSYLRLSFGKDIILKLQQGLQTHLTRFKGRLIGPEGSFKVEVVNDVIFIKVASLNTNYVTEEQLKEKLGLVENNYPANILGLLISDYEADPLIQMYLESHVKLVFEK